MSQFCDFVNENAYIRIERLTYDGVLWMCALCDMYECKDGDVDYVNN